MRIALDSSLLVAHEQLAGALGELARQAAVASLVHEELLVAARRLLAVQRELLARSTLGLKRNRFQYPQSTAFFISVWQLAMPPLMECISHGEYAMISDGP